MTFNLPSRMQTANQDAISNASINSLTPAVLAYRPCKLEKTVRHRVAIWMGSFFMLLILSPLACQAACVAGDVLWVKETVAATVVGTNNNSALPYGIQAAFRNACAGATINIVAGVNNYNHNSASWTGRDDQPTDPTIYIDTVEGVNSGFVKVVGYADVNTPCALSAGVPIANCPVTLDFDGAFVLGSGGVANPAFQTAAAVPGHFTDDYGWKFIRVTNSALDAFSFTQGRSQNWIFYRGRIDHNGIAGTTQGRGWNVTNGGNTGQRIVASEFDHNSSWAVFSQSPDFVLYYNQIHDNGVNATGERGGVHVEGETTLISNVFWGNICSTIAGNGAQIVVNNSVRSTTAANCGGTPSLAFAGGGEILFNAFAGNAGAGFNTSATPIVDLILGNNYSNNSPNIDAVGYIVFDEDNVSGGGEDQSTITFTSATDASPTAGGNNANTSLSYPTSTPPTSNFQKGAIQVRTSTTIINTAGQGGNSAYAH